MLKTSALVLILTATLANTAFAAPKQSVPANGSTSTMTMHDELVLDRAKGNIY
jgi:hypothetical protein